MNAAFSTLLLALPTLLVTAAFVLWRVRPARFRIAKWVVLGSAWAVTAWFLISYSQQTNDVGLMVDGILGGAAFLSALLATIAAVFLSWRQ